MRSSNDFKRKLGHLKQALSTIKTNLSSFKQSASVKHLKQSSLPMRCSHDQKKEGGSGTLLADHSRASISNGSQSRTTVV